MESANKISIVHTNLVAPIIIKNCQEEFQHVSDLKDPVVYGRYSQHCVTEHPLIQVRPTVDIVLYEQRFFHIRSGTAQHAAVAAFTLECSDCIALRSGDALRRTGSCVKEPLCL